VSFSIVNDEKITSSIFFNDGIFYIDLKGLKTLNTFMKSTLLLFINIAIKLVKTIKKSNLFQLSNI